MNNSSVCLVLEYGSVSPESQPNFKHFASWTRHQVTQCPVIVMRPVQDQAISRETQYKLTLILTPCSWQSQASLLTCCAQTYCIIHISATVGHLPPDCYYSLNKTPMHVLLYIKCVVSPRTQHMSQPTRPFHCRELCALKKSSNSCHLHTGLTTFCWFSLSSLSTQTL